MATVETVTASNQSILSSLQRPLHVVVVGGTSGIGRGIALAYGRHCPDAHVTIVGRNETAANEILAQLGPHGKFIRCDCTLMSEIRKITPKIDAVDVLVLSQGVLRMGPRSPTKENIDDRAALNYYGRVLFAQELLPLLRASPIGGKVLFILNSKFGNPSKIDWNDLGLERNTSFLTGVKQIMAFSDLAVQYLGSQPENTDVAFIHAYPGSVKTSIGDNLPFYIRWSAKVFDLFGMSCTPDVCAEFMIHGILGTEKGWRLIDEKGETVTNKKGSDEEMLKKVWEHTCEMTSRTAQA
ncbi:unnamed protein product [Adineta ricciae]|uniref:Uncharacterized protein n=1 Tax=Adineta ricciae TaxID=249248 RepID=A0A814JY83_ADIRI|nr:unnamed protein product [Adineta ricciae]